MNKTTLASNAIDYDRSKQKEAEAEAIPRVTRDSSMALQIMTQSFLNCLVRMA